MPLPRLPGYRPPRPPGTSSFVAGIDAKERPMKHRGFAGAAAVLFAAVLVAPPPADAG
jgi:hypothetical protein